MAVDSAAILPRVKMAVLAGLVMLKDLGRSGRAGFHESVLAFQRAHNAVAEDLRALSLQSGATSSSLALLTTDGIWGTRTRLQLVLDASSLPGTQVRSYMTTYAFTIPGTSAQMPTWWVTAGPLLDAAYGELLASTSGAPVGPRPDASDRVAEDAAGGVTVASGFDSEAVIRERARSGVPSGGAAPVVRELDPEGLTITGKGETKEANVWPYVVAGSAVIVLAAVTLYWVRS